MLAWISRRFFLCVVFSLRRQCLRCCVLCFFFSFFCVLGFHVCCVASFCVVVSCVFRFVDVFCAFCIFCVVVLIVFPFFGFALVFWSFALFFGVVLRFFRLLFMCRWFNHAVSLYHYVVVRLSTMFMGHTTTVGT